jgi:hypothetical protein
MEIEAKLVINGNRARLSLREKGGSGELAFLAWEDRRDLADKFFAKLEQLLEKSGHCGSEVKSVDFACDSPYFGDRKELKMENLDSTGRCGFTAWQTGEILAEVLNFARKK